MKQYLLTASLLVFAAPAWAEAPVYATPQDALEALAAALADGSVEATVSAIDPDAIDLFRDPDDPGNTAHLTELFELYQQGYRFVPENDGLTIELGREDWPLAVPLARTGDGWSFDLAAGRDELTSREIGRNELAVIDALQAYVTIQRAFREVDHDGDGLLEFASQLISTAEARDGLYWPGEDSPVGDMAARANLDGFDQGGGPEAPEPFRGYYFRLLQEQGSNAPGGAYSYLVGGNMLAGHAMLAVPAEYGVTGIKTFLVSEAGVVMERDLGPETIAVAIDINSYDPDEEWSRVEAD